MKRVSAEQGYDLYAQEYRRDHAHLDSFMDGGETEAWLWAVEQALSSKPKLRVMDAGCGDGRTLGRWMRRIEKKEWQSRMEVWGTDISAGMIRAARARIDGVHWDRLDLANRQACQNWAQSRGLCDVISAFFVMVHFDSIDIFFDAIRPLLAPGGYLVVNSIPQPQAPELRVGGKPITIEAWDHRIEDVLERAQDQGFNLVSRRDYFEKNQLTSVLLTWKATVC